MDSETTLIRLKCLGAAVKLAKGEFDETPQQKQQRRKLIARIAATDATCKELEAAAKTWADRRVIAETWATLWKEVQRELRIRKVKA